MVIYVEGIIGAGKSVFVRELNDLIPGSVAYYEKVRHDLLAPFYRDVEENHKPSAAAFALQIRVMTDRFRAHSEGWRYEWMTGCQTIHDRSIHGDWAFVEMLHDDGFISEEDYRSYMDLRRVLMENVVIHAPQLCVYLDVDPKVSCNRKDERGRSYEGAVTTAYQKALREQYETKVLPEMATQGTKIVMIPWNEFGDARKILKDVKELNVLKWGMEKVVL